MTGLDIVEAFVCICFPEIATFVAIANIVLSGWVRIYKKLQNHEEINLFQDIIDAEVGVALNLTKLKFVNKSIGKIGKFLANGKIGNKLLKFGNKIGQFAERIDKRINKNERKNEKIGR